MLDKNSLPSNGNLIQRLGIGFPYFAALPADLYRSDLVGFVEITPETICRQRGTGKSFELNIVPGLLATARDTCAGLPVVVGRGLSDGLVPPAFSSAPYVAAARGAGHEVGYWQVRNAEHFDAFLGFPGYAARYVPLLPYVYAALDRVDAHLDSGAPLPRDAVIATTPRGADPLEAGDLAIPR